MACFFPDAPINFTRQLIYFWSVFI